MRSTPPGPYGWPSPSEQAPEPPTTLPRALPFGLAVPGPEPRGSQAQIEEVDPHLRVLTWQGPGWDGDRLAVHLGRDRASSTVFFERRWCRMVGAWINLEVGTPRATPPGDLSSIAADPVFDLHPWRRVDRGALRRDPRVARDRRGLWVELADAPAVLACRVDGGPAILLDTDLRVVGLHMPGPPDDVARHGGRAGGDPRRRGA